jgi:hypothetical protein
MRRRFRPQLEQLGDRVVPSATPLLPGVPALPPQYQLLGHADGSFAAIPTIPDTGNQFDLTGQGRFLGLDMTNVSGWVRTTGFVGGDGHATGSVTLQTAKGSVTLELTGPPQPGFSSLPEQFSYTVTGGTGAYARVTGQGTLELLLAATPAGAVASPVHGSFALVVGQLSRPGAALDGALSGHLTAAPVNPGDVGAFFSVTGAGTLVGEGQVNVSGWLRATGMVQNGHAAGMLTITGPQGSLTVELRGPAQSAFSPLPGQFSLIVRSGTGAYAHLHAGGVVSFALDQGGGFSLAILA